VETKEKLTEKINGVRVRLDAIGRERKVVVMSEYQYYEFVAVDGPISDEGLKYARACSTRAEVSPYRWSNVYEWGNFSGSVERLLDYYDAHVYVTNWGSLTFAVGFTPGTLDADLIRQYEDEDAYGSILQINASRKRSRQTVWWYRHDEEVLDWEDGDGLLDHLIGIREELLSGDYRALFIGWLATFDIYEVGGESEEEGAGEHVLIVPEIPAGMKALTAPQASLAKAIQVDPDLLEAASEFSGAKDSELIPLSKVLSKMSVIDVRAYLKRVGEGDGGRVCRELNRSRIMKRVEAPSASISGSALAARAREIRDTRLRKEREKAHRNRRKREAVRKRHLQAVYTDAKSIWGDADRLAAECRVKSYDLAAAKLKELRDSYNLSAKDAQFQGRLAEFRKRWSRRPAMMQRIAKL